MARKNYPASQESLDNPEIFDSERAEVTRAVVHHMSTGNNPLDLVQIQDQATGEYLPIEEVVEQYKHPRKFPQGAPSTYNHEFHPRAAFILCAEHGCQYDQLATHFGVRLSTIRAWVWRYSAFAAAVKNGWTIHMVGTAERALVKRACGYSYEETVTARVPIYAMEPDPVSGVLKKVIKGHELVVTQRTTKHQPPDTTALMFLLQNRDGQRWRNVRKVEHSGTVDYAIPGQASTTTTAEAVVQLTTEELEQVTATAQRLGFIAGAGDPVPVETADVETPVRKAGHRGQG